MRAALLQLTSSDDPGRNLDMVLELVRQAAADGAELVVTPEVTNCVSASRKRQDAVLKRESEDVMLATLRKEAAGSGDLASARVDRRQVRPAGRAIRQPIRADRT